jgi:hypothetical protein
MILFYLGFSFRQRLLYCEIKNYGKLKRQTVIQPHFIHYIKISIMKTLISECFSIVFNQVQAMYKRIYRKQALIHLF